jgi:hypothetical protein
VGGHAHPAQTPGCEACQQTQVQAQTSTCWILWQALFSPSLLKKTMPVFNKWNWTEASYKAAAFYQNEEKRANRSTIHKHLTYPVRFWCEQPRGYQVQSKVDQTHAELADCSQPSCLITDRGSLDVHTKMIAPCLKARSKTAITRTYLQDLRTREREQQRYWTACQKLTILSSSTT